MRNPRGRTIALVLLVVAGLVGVGITAAYAAPCPWSLTPTCSTVTQNSPTDGAVLGTTVALSSTVKQNEPARGNITHVEWWLYHDSFKVQNPNNEEGKVLLDERVNVPPSSGTLTNGTWLGSWTVPASRSMTARDGDYAHAGLRTYTLPLDGQYRIETHVLDAEWDRTYGGPPGRSGEKDVTLPFQTAPPPPPTGAVPSGKVQVGTVQFTLSGTNIFRSAGTLVRYTGSTSPANQWGVEVSVVDNKVVERRSFQPGMPIPSGGFVLSGHGAAADFLLANGAVGAGVWTAGQVPGGGGTPTPTPTPTTPTPTPTPTTTTPPPTGGNLISNPTLATGSPMPTCFQEGSWGTMTRTAALNADVPSGVTGRSWRIAISGYSSGDAKLLQSEATGCGGTVSTGTTYQMSVQYKSTTPTNSIELFTYRAGTGWAYWTTLASLPTAGSWTKVTRTLPAIPAGVSRVSYGLAATGNGVLYTTDYYLGTGGTNPPPVDPPPGGLATTGRWTVNTVDMPIRALHGTLLRDGRVLLIAGSGNDANAFAAGTFRTVVWNPANNSFTNVPTPIDMFCAGHVTLADGRVLVAGGTLSYPGVNGQVSYKGAKVSYIFNPSTNAFTKINDTIEGHWYPTLTKLENGDVWAAGGYSDDGSGPAFSTEMFSQATGVWLTSAQVPQSNHYWGTYPHMFLMADGRMFYTGGHTFGGSHPGSGATIYNWRNATWGDIPGLRDKELRDQAGSVLLPPAQNQTFMIAGGGSTDFGGATNSVDIVNMNSANPAYTPGPSVPGLGRQYLNLTTLFDRTVLASNGGNAPRGGNVFAASVYSPSANAWTEVAPDPVGRNYHSAALLLPDGRVAVFGSNPADGSFELRISVYEPGYLFKGTRPGLSSVPATTTNGAAISVNTTGTIVSASLTSPMSSTHQTDTNSRLIDLPMTGAGGTKSLTIPANDALVPPGPYMLTVVSDTGVPSVARWITVS